MNHTTRYFFLLLIFASTSSFTSTAFLSYFSMLRLHNKVYSYFFPENPILPPEIINMICNRVVPLKWRVLSVTSKTFYSLFKEYREEAINEKAKYEASKFIQNFDADYYKFPLSKIRHNFSDELKKFYENQYLHFIFFYGEWGKKLYDEQLIKGRKISVIPDAWYFCKSNAYYDAFENCNFLSLVHKHDPKKRYTTVYCSETLSQNQLKMLLEYTKDNPTIQNIHFKSISILNTSGKINTLITLMKDNKYRGIITVPHSFRDTTSSNIIWATCAGTVPMNEEQFGFFLNQNSFYSKYQKPGYNGTPLHILIGCENHPHLTLFAKLLLDHNTNPNKQDKNGFTVLHLLAQNSYQEKSDLGVMKLCLDNKKYPANPHIKGKDGKIPLDYFNKNHNIEAENLLIKYMNPDHPSVKRVLKGRSEKKNYSFVCGNTRISHTIRYSTQEYLNYI